ncbi:Uncharacterized protein SCF082_LOCUS24957, partial [Durusdinium trenchii]
ATARPTAAPTPQYLDTRVRARGREWADKEEGRRVFKEQVGTCYFANIIRRVNNRPGNNLNCYAACTGLNLHLRDTQKDQQCVGWTMVRRKICSSDQSGTCHEDKMGSNTCLLHHTFNAEASYNDPACVSGKLLPHDLKQATDKEAAAEGEDTQIDIDVEGDDDGIALKTPSGIKVPDFGSTCPQREVQMSKGPRKGGASQRPMRVFVACLQASGCTLLSYLLAQRDGTTSILDLGVRQDFPGNSFFERAEKSFPAVDTIVIKYPLRGIKAANPLEWMANVKKRFQPDVSILFSRDPVDMFHHLINHIGNRFANRIPPEAELSRCKAVKGDSEPSYGLACGTPESKLRAINKLYVNRDKAGFTGTITFEEICSDRGALAAKLASMGVCIPEENLRQPKWSIVDVMRFSYKYFLSERRSNGGVFWGPGDLENTFHDSKGIPVTERQAYRLCPLEKSNKIRAKLLSHSIPPYSDMTFAQVCEIVEQNAPDLFKHYEGKG